MKIYKIVYLPLAEQDIVHYADQILEYTGHIESIKRFLKEIKAAVEQLQSFPYSCAVYYAVRQLSYEFRVKPCGKYNIYYVVDEMNKQVLIARIILAKNQQNL